MNWSLQNWYWISLGIGILIYLLRRRRGPGQPQAVHDDDHKGLFETDGDPSKRPRRRRVLPVNLSTSPGLFAPWHRLRDAFVQWTTDGRLRESHGNARIARPRRVARHLRGYT
jgi:hypothetical protein